MDLQILRDTPPWEWPESAGKTFLAILRDPKADAADRLLAAALAGDFTVINDALADTLLAILGNAAEPEELRAQAAISLGPATEQADIDEFDDPESVPISEKMFRRIKQFLRKLFLDSGVPNLVRRSILEAAVRAPEDWHTGAIHSAWSNDDRQWKLTAAFCMGHVRGFDREILQALQSADAGIHYQAVRAAGTWEVDAAWPHVAALATSAHTNKDLRLAAIEALGTIRPDESMEILVDLSDSEDEDIAETAGEALSMAEGMLDDVLDEDEFDEDGDEFEDEEDDDDDDEPDNGNDKTVH
jgi:HEAT repeat protein